MSPKDENLSRPKRMTLWSKIWKSIIALSVLFGLISVTEVKFDLISWAIIIIFFITLAIYWHILEWVRYAIYEIKAYFINLKDDIKYIKGKVGKRGGNNG